VEIAASQFAEWDIRMEVCRWLNVGMSEKLSDNPVGISSMPNSSFVLHTLFNDLATVVHKTQGIRPRRRVSMIRRNSSRFSGSFGAKQMFLVLVSPLLRSDSSVFLGAPQRKEGA